MELKAVLTIVDDVAEAAGDLGIDVSPEDVAAMVGNFLNSIMVQAKNNEGETAFVCFDFVRRIAEEVAKTTDE